MAAPRSDDDLRDPELAALYRELDRAEPPAALDARVLDAARRELSRRPARRSRWRRFAIPVSAAAVLALTVALTLVVEREQARQASPAEAARVPAPHDSAGVQKPPPAPVPAPRRSEEAPSGRPAPSKPREAAAPAATPSAKMKEEATSFGADTARARTAPRQQDTAEPRDGAPPAAAPVPEQETTAQPAAPSAESDAPYAAERSAVKAKRAADAADKRAASDANAMEERAAAGLRPAQPWLEEIRAMRRAGQLREAAEALAAFRQAYPDYPLPEDLR